MAKPSKRMAARQAELSRRKKQQRPLGLGEESSEGSAGAAVAEPPTDHAAENQSGPTTPGAPGAAAPVRPEAPRQAGFRQPSFRSGSRNAAMARPDGQPDATSSVGRPMPKNPYQTRDLRAIAVITTLLLAGLIALKLVL